MHVEHVMLRCPGTQLPASACPPPSVSACRLPCQCVFVTQELQLAEFGVLGAPAEDRPQPPCIRRRALPRCNCTYARGSFLNTSSSGTHCCVI